MMGNENRFTFGPPRYYQPISAKGPTGWTFHGPIGYEEIKMSQSKYYVALRGGLWCVCRVSDGTIVKASCDKWRVENWLDSQEVGSVDIRHLAEPFVKSEETGQ